MDTVTGKIVPNNFDLSSRLAGYLNTLAGENDLFVALFKTNAVMGRLTTLADLVEADFSGYDRASVSDSGPFIGIDAVPFAVLQTAIFTHNGGAINNTIYSVGFLTEPATGSNAAATATQVGGHVATVTVTTHGSGYTAVPKVTITDATTGENATAHAVMNGDQVDHIVIDTPGNDYTGPVIHIDVALVFRGGFPLATPRAMTALSVSLPVACEFTQEPQT